MLTKWTEESPIEIRLTSTDHGQRVLAIAVQEDGHVEFYELCDECFGISMTREDAILALQEAIAWIEANPLGSEQPAKE